MNYWKQGQIDGKDQAEMDKLTETKREGELLAYTAVQSEHFEMPLGRVSLTQYTCGFVHGYLLTVFGKSLEESEEAVS